MMLKKVPLKVGHLEATCYDLGVSCNGTCKSITKIEHAFREIIEERCGRADNYCFYRTSQRVDIPAT